MNNLRKQNKKMKKNIVKLIRLYQQEVEIYDNWETESAPSGEWAEYNYDFIAQEARVYALREALDILEV